MPPDSPAIDEHQNREPRDRRGTVRALIESSVCLLLAVLLFRTFAAEGYMISTGSMAPHLLGFHKRVICPACGHAFPFGVAYDTDPRGVTAAETNAFRAHAVCPNCNQHGINVVDVPRNHGDQLLVFKPAYSFQAPRRWEVVVFRNPHNPTEAYVKRLVGLPGERVQIIDGDVYADGELCRKDWSDQRALRIPVHQHRAPASSDANHQPHWRLLPAATASGWQADGDRFILHAADVAADDAWSWVEYVHRIRRGGQHETVVPLEAWPKDIEPSSIPPAGLKYDADKHHLRCIGALPETVRDRLLSHPADELFSKAVCELYEQSHIVPISDEYGYNPREGDHVPVPVRDLMIALRLNVERGDGEFAIELSDGATQFTVVFDFARDQARLYAGDNADAVATESLSSDAAENGSSFIEVSLFDQQLLVAKNGRPLLGPWTFTTPENTPPPRYPVQFGARGLNAAVSDLVLYRDVYYTTSRGRNAVQRPFQLSDSELFVLGDNSPVSHDSRRWSDGAVPTNLLIGKPFLVHLPSKPGRLRVGGYEVQLRLPDWERIQWLR